MEQEVHSQDFLVLCLFPPSLSISYIKNCHILSQNVKYGTFVTNVTKNLTYALWGNNSGSNLLHTRKLRKLCQPGSQHKFLGLWCHIMLSSEKGKTRSPNNDQVDTILFYKGFILPTADNEKLIPGLQKNCPTSRFMQFASLMPKCMRALCHIGGLLVSRTPTS